MHGANMKTILTQNEILLSVTKGRRYELSVTKGRRYEATYEVIIPSKLTINKDIL
jgi:hypothetical protein